MYEIGRVIDGVREDGICCERKKLGVILFDRSSDEKAVYFRMKDILQALGLVLKNKEMRFAPRLDGLSPLASSGKYGGHTAWRYAARQFCRCPSEYPAENR